MRRPGATDYAEAPGVDQWVRASACEALARAHAAAGDGEPALEARDRSLALLESIDDEEDREIIAADLDTLPL